MLIRSGVVLVTGTGTSVGKTMATAALALAALEAGRSVAVVKPVQTGVGPGEPGDIAEVIRLLGPQAEAVTTREFFRLPEPLAPQAAARRAGVSLPALGDHARRITELAVHVDLVLVEGAGGLLVRLDGVDSAGGTLADLARLVVESDPGAAPVLEVGAVIVTGPELGTLNVTELTVEALRRRGVPILGLVIGRWPADPGPAELGNRRDLPELTGVPLLGLIPESPPLPPRLLPADLVDPDPVDSDPVDSDPDPPEPADPEPADPEPADPEPADPEPADPEPADPEPARRR
jgi:dethiobiotin synthetase